MRDARRSEIATEAWSWVEANVHPHLAAGGSLHSKGSNGLPAEFRRRFLTALDAGPVRYATPAALAVPAATRIVEHVIPMKRVAIEIFDPSRADPRSNTCVAPLAGGPARGPQDILRIFDRLCMRCWVTADEHARLNTVARSYKWDAPNGDGWARYRAADIDVVEVAADGLAEERDVLPHGRPTTRSDADPECPGEWVVYPHYAAGSGAPFHIGSGRPERATSPVRGAAWQAHVARLGDDWRAEILEHHRCPARARLREAQLIHLHQPPTNRHHRQGPHRRVLLGHAKGGAPCCCGAPDCYRREVEASERVDMPV